MHLGNKVWSVSASVNFCMFHDKIFTFEKGEYVFQDVMSAIIKIYSLWAEL